MSDEIKYRYKIYDWNGNLLGLNSFNESLSISI